MPPTTLQHRKATGQYYTPAPLINLLLNHALKTRPEKILDPSCGPGDFLLAAQTRLPQSELFGIDIDAQAIQQATHNLSRNNINPNHLHLQAANALLNPPAFLKPQSFDLILGNPPYVNGIEANLTQELKAQLREKFPAVRGAADLAHFFLQQAVHLVKPGGRIAFVLPRALLNSPAAQSFRANLPSHLRPNLIYAPERCDFFPRAAIFICLLILGPDPLCEFSTDPNPETAQFTTAPITTHNWWLALQQAAHDHPPQSGPTLSSQFQIAASMTAGDAYDLVPHLIDSANAPAPKLLTTGLIEPRATLWGHQPCRYLKKDYQYPRIQLSEKLTRSLSARAASATRPKIIVAGLSKKLEAYLDKEGEYLGAVSTFTIFHPQNDLAALNQLLDHLLADSTTQYLINHLGANGLRGRHITLKKSFLRDLPLPS